MLDGTHNSLNCDARGDSDYDPIRGSNQPLIPELDVTLPRLDRQAKPNEFYELLHAIFNLKEMSCLELFSRREFDPHFDLWGQEVPNYFQKATLGEVGGTVNMTTRLFYEDVRGNPQEREVIPFIDLQEQAQEEEEVGERPPQVTGLVMDGFESMLNNVQV